MQLIPGSDNTYRFNYWGYSTTAFFAPMMRYSQAAADGHHGREVVREFKKLVRECHKRGLEVIMDVVFNHTAEGNERGPTISFRCAAGTPLINCTSKAAANLLLHMHMCCTAGMCAAGHQALVIYICCRIHEPATPLSLLQSGAHTVAVANTTVICCGSLQGLGLLQGPGARQGICADATIRLRLDSSSLL